METSVENNEDKVLDGGSYDDVRFVFVRQESVSVYEVRDSLGEVVNIVIAEGIDDPERFQSRTVAEQDAMKTLALDEYYGGSEWEGPTF
ncbi:hypothetical protein FAES_pFAES01051 (plasmid) [Fibrella aestuarina BUZ 2]|uniref:Uncharacterized protein n=1 Tax=Fibrella aestuarina BUZ 2 TaxID=1166018 RepID=I0KHE2_9BACT|nr:hypothetical protein [Fibrella aestuarina]CCH03545.1 hypothetical protein FAES_pFAES01051 [Fibrella aestuarina BUZ 2]